MPKEKKTSQKSVLWDLCMDEQRGTKLFLRLRSRTIPGLHLFTFVVFFLRQLSPQEKIWKYLLFYDDWSGADRRRRRLEQAVIIITKKQMRGCVCPFFSPRRMTQPAGWLPLHTHSPELHVFTFFLDATTFLWVPTSFFCIPSCILVGLNGFYI